MKRTPLVLSWLVGIVMVSLVGSLAGCSNNESTSQPASPSKTTANAAPAAANPNVPGNAQSQASKLGYNTNNARK